MISSIHIVRRQGRLEHAMGELGRVQGFEIHAAEPVLGRAVVTFESGDLDEQSRQLEWVRGLADIVTVDLVYLYDDQE